MISSLIYKIKRLIHNDTNTKNIPDPAQLIYTQRKRYIITDLICAYLDPSEQITILDGGARSSFDDPRWNVFDERRIKLLGFEVDVDECEALNKLAKEKLLDYQFYPIGLWSESIKKTFYENKSPGGGSFYPQNVEFTNRWKFQNTEQKFNSKDIFYPTKTLTWEMTSISEWAATNKIKDIDFLSINVQGAELEILVGLGPLLDNVIGIQAEVSFVESYKGRPFFSDIDNYLRNNGFMFYDLIGHHLVGRADSPITSYHTHGLYPYKNQLIEGHAIYFKDPIDLDKQSKINNMNTPKVLKLICLAEIYGQTEFAFELLVHIINKLNCSNEKQKSADIESIYSSALKKYQEYLGGK